ncbi:MAG TPA: SDR family oxidoreductase [Dongiaceae bacterium]|nr:SDR family oxidoreductase [Dongiaceae bacterium]
MKTVVITGGNAGIGLATAQHLAQQGQRVILACRDQAKAERAIQGILRQTPNADVRFYPLDLASFDSIRQFATRVQQDFPSIDALINNAGAYPTQQQFTRDNFELQFGVNYLGHFQLTHLLLPALQKAGTARIVHLSSIMHNLGRIDFDSFRGRKRYSGTSAYAQSKLANLLFSNELARRLPAGVTSNALHPGGVDSEIYRDLPGWLYKIFLKPFLITADRAARLIADMALGENWRGKSGQFKSAHGPLPVSRHARNLDLSRRLYEESCALSGVGPL